MCACAFSNDFFEPLSAGLSAGFFAEGMLGLMMTRFKVRKNVKFDLQIRVECSNISVLGW